MKQLYFVRHGASEGNLAGIWTGTIDSPLAKEGKQQAQALAQEIAASDVRFDKIYSSPLSRARDTADYIAQAIEYPADAIEILEDLIERSFGELEGTSNKEAIAAYLKHESMIDDYPNVESLEHMHERTKKVLAFLQVQPEDTILIVGHGAFARTLRRTIENIPLSEYVEPYPNAKLIKLI